MKAQNIDDAIYFIRKAEKKNKIQGDIDLRTAKIILQTIKLNMSSVTKYKVVAEKEDDKKGESVIIFKS